MWNILICTSSFNKKNLVKKIIPKNLKIRFNPYGRKLKENELLNLIDEKTLGLVSGTETISKKILNKSNNLQVISRCGTGLDNIDKSLFKKNIKIFKTDKEPVLAVSEFVVAQILLTLKNSYYHNNYLKSGKWKKIKAKMLTNSQVGLIGFGKIGKKIKSLIQPFKCKIKIYDPNIKKYSSKKNLDLILKKSKIITLNIPYNKKNKYFINSKKLNQISNDSLLVNCSRGGLIDENALYKKLKNHKTFKAILDCFIIEPYFGKLTKLDNVILSPHVASFTQETRDKMEKNSFINCVKNLKI